MGKIFLDQRTKTAYLDLQDQPVTRSSLRTVEAPKSIGAFLYEAATPSGESMIGNRMQAAAWAMEREDVTIVPYRVAKKLDSNKIVVGSVS